MDDQTNPDEFDPKLEALFEREHTHVPAEPFLGTMLRAVAAARRRAVLKTRLVVVAAFVAVVVLSPQLIAGSVWISSQLDELFAAVSMWLASPLVLVGIVLAALVALATKWARIW